MGSGALDGLTPGFRETNRQKHALLPLQGVLSSPALPIEQRTKPRGNKTSPTPLLEVRLKNHCSAVDLDANQEACNIRPQNIIPRVLRESKVAA